MPIERPSPRCFVGRETPYPHFNVQVTSMNWNRVTQYACPDDGVPIILAKVRRWSVLNLDQWNKNMLETRKFIPSRDAIVDLLRRQMRYCHIVDWLARE